MADLVLSALIPILVEKSADLLAQRIGMMWGIDDQCKKLHDKLLAVQDVITDAEEKEEDQPAVKSWLARLKSAAYDADDVLDEFRYEELREDAVKHGHKAGKGIVRFPGLFRLKMGRKLKDAVRRGHKAGKASGHVPVLFRYKMSRKLKDVVGRIDDLVTDMKTFGFDKGQQKRVVNRVKTHSYVIESEVVGRGEDKEELVKLLTEASPTNIPTVLPIVGMGGLGKTTLAQMVCNDPRVKQHFKLLIWVCVSEKFELLHLIRLIIDTVIKKDSEVPRDNMELLQNRLRQEISGQRYLLVLDDVWNDEEDKWEDKWEQLRVLLNCSDLGSTVLVTTRDNNVASIMGAVQRNSLRSLGEKDSWNLFHKRAFGNGIIEERPKLVEIGKNLVQNCGGLPLAIRTLGGLMSNKHDVGEWLEVLEESKTWKHKPANNKVLPILRLSYDHLPPYMKQCFAFCAVFPKDFVMVKEKLVQYWMANGFIPSERPGNLEMTGSDIFDELAWRSFFQDVKQVLGEHGYRPNKTTCKMHDLIHDLAQSVMRDECLSLQASSQIHNIPQCNVRHISWERLPMPIDEAIEFFPVARSLIFNGGVNMDTKEKIKVPKSNSLRVLDLPHCSAELVMAIPFGKLKHLRYLNLSYMGSMKTLPDAITTLYLLQTFDLRYCSDLSQLPKGMRYMTSLRHLYIEGCSKLQCMPPSLGELKCLQTLSFYIVGIGEGNKIGELNTLNLGGRLEVYNLREISDVRDAKEANMASKQNLDHLTLCWGMRKHNSSVQDAESNGSKTIVVDDVLDALKPCSKLKALEINGYIGDNFPIWMTGLENLVELHIIECRKCTKLPPLHWLPLLQVLHIKCMDNLRQLCCGVFMSAEGGEVSAITFPSLKSFYLHKMANLDCWYEGDIGDKSRLIFPVLSYLSIKGCPMLSAIPVTPLLKTMEVRGNKTLPSLATGITTIQKLDLVGSGENLSFKPWVSLQRLGISGFNHIIPPTIGSESEELSVDVNTTALLQLGISSCNFLFSPISSNSPLWVWKCFRFVEVLEIHDCDGFTSWPEEELSNLIYLRKMAVKSCTNFLGSPSEPLSETPTRHALLPKLKKFTIDDCPKMAEIPKLPRSLEKLKIRFCPKLECLPEWLGSLVALKQLKINLLECLNSFPSSIGCLIALETLYIGNCINLASLPEGMQGLEALKDLQIWECPKIRILPEEELFMDLCPKVRSLDRLWIDGCPLLEKWMSERGESTYI